MDVLALAAAATLGTTVVVLALALSSGAAGTQMRGRLEGVMAGSISVIEGPAIDPLRRGSSAIGVFQSIISGAWLRRLETQLRVAGSALQPGDFIAIRIGVAGLAFAIVYLLVGGAIGILAGGGAGAAGFLAPQFWLSQRVAARNKKLEVQLPDGLTFIANSLKAGFGLLQSMSLAAEQLEHPLASELATTVHETNVGSSADQAFQWLSDRNQSYDLDLVVTAILVQRSVGGNLAEVLETVAETMRERVRIKGEITTLTAQQKLTGLVIGLLPVGVGGLFLAVSPAYISVLFTDTLGQVMLVTGVVMNFVGIMVIRRILDIEV